MHQTIAALYSHLSLIGMVWLEVERDRMFGGPGGKRLDDTDALPKSLRMASLTTAKTWSVMPLVPPPEMTQERAFARKAYVAALMAARALVRMRGWLLRCVKKAADEVSLEADLHLILSHMAELSVADGQNFHAIGGCFSGQGGGDGSGDFFVVDARSQVVSTARRMHARLCSLLAPSLALPILTP